jgi:hypothetical protein
MELDVKGLNELISDLKYKSNKRVQDRLELAARRGFEIVATQLSVYPPPRHYIRTYRLKRGWEMAPQQMVFRPGPASKPFNFTANMTNPTEYVSDVQGGKDDETQQKPIHAGIWEVDDEIVARAEPDVEDVFQQAANDIASFF